MIEVDIQHCLALKNTTLLTTELNILKVSKAV